MRNCRVCALPIAPARLAALPHTSTCVLHATVKPYTLHEDMRKRVPKFAAEDVDVVAIRTDRDDRTAYKLTDLEEL